MADWTLEHLLDAMKLAFDISSGGLGLRGYHANIEGFNAVYAFATQDDAMQTAAVFKDGKMGSRHMHERMGHQSDVQGCQSVLEIHPIWGPRHTRFTAGQ